MNSSIECIRGFQSPSLNFMCFSQGPVSVLSVCFRAIGHSDHPEWPQRAWEERGRALQGGWAAREWVDYCGGCFEIDR